MQAEQILKRFDAAFEQSRAVRTEHQRQVSRFHAVAEQCRRLRVEIQALAEQLGPRSRARFQLALQSIDLSEAYGTLHERFVILKLADALVEADANLTAMANVTSSRTR
jgi:hypothetical protein